MHIIRGMDFTCNAAKNDTNVRERGLPLLAARVIFNADLRVREDTRKAYPERRFIGYNTIEGPLQPHIISFRKANDREQKKLEAQSR